jgi:hypothetical protein
MTQWIVPVLLREPLRRVLLVLAFFVANAIAATLACAATTAATFSRTDHPAATKSRSTIPRPSPRHFGPAKA